ncbi:uncharacterized protein LOC122512566 [Leptopilina heterotoma]|uniref:uncharacterized protein LOC122502505 n=1 Tax=Leptopilina heterotoma TaxID=63436 RepID=UPI001CA9D88E|nr:uncharacterized protein LOC122502505 [Leptopilina heterotoma]XP_043476677.1 uncharacterized protein LOC122507820 [Leptopilina heterotoma]XP_043484401.1 uncharacterized protein LOC122512566 [Leptopilina heterotoma]
MTNVTVGNETIERIAVKVPIFMPEDPELWFLLLESSFDAAGITQDATKFGHALSALDPRYSVEIRDVLLKPKAERTFELLKKELISRMGTSQEQNTRRLLENEPLGDRKPTQFLRHLRNLAGSNFPDDVLQTLWLGRLPKHMQAMLAAHRDLPLDKRAEIADSVAEAYGSLCNVAETRTAVSAATTSSTTGTSFEARFASLEQSLALVLQKFASLEVNQVSRGRDRSHSRSQFRSRSHSRNRHQRSSDMCWYHWKFGKDAKKCEKPCKFSSAENESGSR